MQEPSPRSPHHRKTRDAGVPRWTVDELIPTLDLYFRVPPGHTSENHPEIVAMSRTLSALSIHPSRGEHPSFRTPSAVYMKMMNFRRCDDGTGLDAGSKLDQVVWDRYANDRERLHEVAEAILAHAATTQPTSAVDQDVDEEESAPEGRWLSRQHRYRERNRALTRKRKRLALAKYGVLRCEVCGMVFPEVYGGMGKEFIECHHTRPIEKMQPGEETKVKDLALVCSNCHGILHRGGSIMTIERLREIVKSGRPK